VYIFIIHITWMQRGCLVDAAIAESDRSDVCSTILLKKLDDAGAYFFSR